MSTLDEIRSTCEVNCQLVFASRSASLRVHRVLLCGVRVREECEHFVCVPLSAMRITTSCKTDVPSTVACARRILMNECRVKEILSRARMARPTPRTIWRKLEMVPGARIDPGNRRTRRRPDPLTGDEMPNRGTGSWICPELSVKWEERTKYKNTRT